MKKLARMREARMRAIRVVMKMPTRKMEAFRKTVSSMLCETRHLMLCLRVDVVAFVTASLPQAAQ